MGKLKNNKKWIILGAVLLVIAVIIIAIGIFPGGILVETAHVEKSEVVKLIKEIGTVESESTIFITAKNTGEIKGIKISEGDEVTSGETLIMSHGFSAQLDIKSLKAELSGLQAQYNQARSLANKNKTLYEQGALSLEEYNQSNTAVKQIGAQVAALNYSIQSMAESSGSSGVTAPIGGVITGVFVKDGQTVPAGTPLFEISNLKDIYVKVDLISEDADRVKIGDKVRIYNEDVDFYDDGGTVKKIHLKAQEKLSDLGVTQKRVTVEIAFGSSQAIRLGSNVEVEVIVAQKNHTIAVSDLCIFEMKHKNYVYVVEAGKALLREVIIGLEGEKFTEITSGLLEGEEVILSPKDDIQDGVKVKTK